MTVPAGSPRSEVPAEDWAEQEAEAGPPAEGGLPGPGILSAGTREANEADLAEQELSVDFDEER